MEATTGDVITVNPGEVHDGNPVQGRVQIWRMLYLDPGFVAETLREDLPGAVEVVRPVSRDAVLAQCFTRLFAVMTGSSSDTFAAEELMRTLAYLMAHHGGRPMPPRSLPTSVTRALRYMNEAPQRPVTLRELAALLGVSRFQFLRGFARAVGTTPHAYLLQQRVGLARRLLASGRFPAEAAAEAGFADQSHLTRAFSRRFGITPARYRSAIA